MNAGIEALFKEIKESTSRSSIVEYRDTGFLTFLMELLSCMNSYFASKGEKFVNDIAAMESTFQPD